MESLMASEEIAFFRLIERLMHDTPEVDLGVDRQGYEILVSCHMVCRALAQLFPQLECQDGYFAREGIEHSWLTWERDFIIDACPVAMVGGPIMVDCRYFTTPWQYLYQPSKERFTCLDAPDFPKHIERVTEAMRSVFQVAA
ncbi:MAG: hypothetical protein Q8P55_00645 [bacterium]|nr:hypothetical protein [bacterium]